MSGSTSDIITQGNEGGGGGGGLGLSFTNHSCALIFVYCA